MKPSNLNQLGLIILIKNRVYALQTIALTENDKNAAQNRFFNSFELLND